MVRKFMLHRGTSWITGSRSSAYKRGNLSKVYKNLKGGCQEDGLFSLLFSGRTRGNKHKHRRFPLNIRKLFLL